jgi:hypothetical protein
MDKHLDERQSAHERPMLREAPVTSGVFPERNRAFA